MSRIDALFVGTDVFHNMINEARNNLDYQRIKLFVSD
jgi:hypothetical protein